MLKIYGIARLLKLYKGELETYNSIYIYTLWVKYILNIEVDPQDKHSLKTEFQQSLIHLF